MCCPCHHWPIGRHEGVHCCAELLEKLDRDEGAGTASTSARAGPQPSPRRCLVSLRHRPQILGFRQRACHQGTSQPLAHTATHHRRPCQLHAASHLASRVSLGGCHRCIALSLVQLQSETDASTGSAGRGVPRLLTGRDTSKPRVRGGLSPAAGSHGSQPTHPRLQPSSVATPSG